LNLHWLTAGSILSVNNPQGVTLLDVVDNPCSMFVFNNIAC